MKIYTSYFGQLKNLQKYNIIPIAICRFLPKYYNGLIYQNIAPSVDILNNCKNSHFEYVQRFNNEILNQLSPLDVYNDLITLTNNNDCALLCYEKTGFCHRFLVSDWLNNNINLNISEYNPNSILLNNPLF